MGFLSGISSFVKEHSDVIHGVLDIAGFIPGVGAVADAANAVTYAIEGNWLEAGSSLISAIPGFGDTFAAAKKSANAVKTGLKSIKELNAVRKAKGMKKLFGVLRGKAKTGATKKIRSLFDKVDEVFDAIKNRQKKVCTGARCFSGDTLVCTRKGYQPIKEIQKGDEVFSRNPETGEVGFKEVEGVFHTTTHTVYHIWVNGKEEFKTTAYHPIYVEEQGWITAINLREGDILETAEGQACITKIVKERHEEAVQMYNMHVKDWVSYFVGRIKAYVHNGAGDHVDDIIRDGSHIHRGKLKKNVKYTTGEYGDYIYQTNGDGLISHVSAEELHWKKHDGRLSHNRNTYDKKKGYDQAGHLIGDRFGGSPKLDNLVSQAKDVNLIAYKKLEDEWGAAVKKGKKVSVDIEIVYDGSSKRPTKFIVDYQIGNNKIKTKEITNKNKRKRKSK